MEFAGSWGMVAGYRYCVNKLLYGTSFEWRGAVLRVELRQDQTQNHHPCRPSKHGALKFFYALGLGHSPF
jgi:hypothetical protein